MVWMMHHTNFTMVPFVGETGRLDVDKASVHRVSMYGVLRISQPRLQWTITSQIKYGRDSRAYALHQLHRPSNNPRFPHSTRHRHRHRHPSTSTSMSTAAPRRGAVKTKTTTPAAEKEEEKEEGMGEIGFVRPVWAARLDLRVRRDSQVTRAQQRHTGPFVQAVESALMWPNGRRRRTWSEACSQAAALGVELSDGFAQFGNVMREMDRAWHGDVRSGAGLGGRRAVEGGERVGEVAASMAVRKLVGNDGAAEQHGSVRIVAPHVGVKAVGLAA